MPVASNSLLQLSPTTTANSATSAGAATAAELSNGTGPSFSDVYANQQPSANATSRTTLHGQLASGADDKPSATDGGGVKKAQVADGGKKLPASKESAAAGEADAKTDKPSKGDKAAKDDDTVASDDDPALASDGAQASVVVPAPLPEQNLAPLPAVPAEPAAAQPDPSALAQQAAAATAPVPAPVAANDDSQGDDFDPAADPLEGLPMVRMALEQNAKAQGTTSAHAQPAEGNGKGEQSDGQQPFADNLSALAQPPKAEDGTAGQGDASLAKPSDDASQTTASGSPAPRAEDFASRLHSLTAATPAGDKTAAAAASQQPLQMQQSGWSEGLVNRVMYLSSQNLKSADIQLHPLELGRLDIRVDVTADQQTQVTFSSVHPAVREALDNQQGRLRDMLSQQGLGNVDVNVSDQSRQQQQQQQQQQQLAANGQRGSGGAGGQGGEGAMGEVSQAEAASQPQVVIGSSAVDYYA
ncbi:flagellar hook-length control protein FliK [Pseudomonas typographi]|uniref:flagellar hook-length control protein FliK n=1 Tax=Pseudomonas typographi TaxID=2715964 RepID=UPI0016855EC7|nr:flagellar hook-length control protein FliK [Pseudomonas typographi]MBD1553949.1 flagellar hook-length control protein FliK [Pseudomonas typographi]